MVLADLFAEDLPTASITRLPLLIALALVVEAHSQVLVELGVAPSNDGVLLLFVVVGDIETAEQEPFAVAHRV